MYSDDDAMEIVPTAFYEWLLRTLPEPHSPTPEVTTLACTWVTCNGVVDFVGTASEAYCRICGNKNYLR